MHVRAHEGAVGVVVGQEGDHGSSDGDHHPWADVHEVHFILLHADDLVAVAAGNAFVDKAAVLVRRLRGLGHDILVLYVGGHIDHLVRHPARGVVHLAEGRLDKAVLVDAGIGGEVVDQADVGTFGGLDGTHAAIVAVVDVAHVHAGPFAAQAAGSQGGQTPLVG